MELIAVTAQYNPFAEKAGMKLITRWESHSTIVEAVEMLRGFFNPALIASEAYNRRRLWGFTPEIVDDIRDILLDVNSHYYKRLMSTGRSYI